MAYQDLVPQESPMPSIANAISIPQLRAGLTGRVIAPADPDYDEARTVFLGGVDRRPGVIVRVADATDVVKVVSLARDTGVPLAVRSGGHSSAAHSVIDDGIVIDLRDMRALDIDPGARTAWAETGLTAVEVTGATAEHGLAIGFGDTGSVGIGGITLGGGVGYLVRAHGLTIDSLLAAEIVTADGEIVRADATTHPDLFWAIRGGGGNFGVVTRFLYRLHALGQIVGGLLILPATPDTVAGFIAANEAAPESLSAIANVMPCPPMPFIADEHHGRLVILGIMCHSGAVEDGDAVLAPFRALATPLADLVHLMPYPEIYPPDDPDYRPLAVSKNLFMDGFDVAIATTILERLEASDATMRVAQLRVLGGAYARVPNDATAYGHRDRRIMVNVASFYDGPDDLPTRAAWVDSLCRSLAGDDEAAYVNFIGDEGEARIRAAYPGATWDRLAAIKARYDPANLFRNNQNIPPAVATTQS